MLPPAPTTPPAPVVTVTSVVNAATFAVTPLVPGSLGTLLGANLSGKSVSVTFDGSAATLLYVGATQINLQVPASLGSKTSATLVVTVDGSSSAPQTVALAPVWPAIFAHGVLNQDNTENTAATPAKAGSVLQIFATGIPASATVSVQIADRKNLIPPYAGAAPGLTGVQQVNVTIPADLGAGATQLIVCATAGSQQACSAGVPGGDSVVMHRVLPALIAAAALLTTGCGYTGDPLPPLANIPARVLDLAAIQRGGRIMVQFTVPPRTTEGVAIKTPLKLDLRIGTAEPPFSQEAGPLTPHRSPQAPSTTGWLATKSPRRRGPARKPPWRSAF